jgi:putative ABC transport system permease protein
LVTYEEENYQEQNWFFAAPEIFQVFDYELIKGDKKTCLNDPFTVILSASIAQKYFGSEDPMGKVLRVNDENDVRVTGVFNDITENAHFVTDALISMETGKSVYNQLVLNNWGEGSTYTYLVLPKEKTEAGIEARFPAFIEKNIGEGSSEGIGIDLQKMTDIHLHSNLRGEIQANSVFLFSPIQRKLFTHFL